MGKLNVLFPSNASFQVFLSYITLFVSSGLLTVAVQKKHPNGLNQTILVLLSELLKLAICLAIYLTGSPDLIRDVKRNQRLFILYLIPALLYCFYNNLAFINLRIFDPTTYYCLMQFRVALTAIIYQLIFNRKLTSTQWISLMVLTLGCLIKEYGVANQTAGNYHQPSPTSTTESDLMIIKEHKDSMPLVSFFWLTSSILLQMFCSCFAGVYNEFLLKDSSTSATADVILQNIFMYIDSILCNLIFYYIATPGTDSKPDQNWLVTLNLLLRDPMMVILVFNNAFSGLVASLFLKNLNSILKTFAAAIELFAVAILAWFIFNNVIDVYTVIALVVVSTALVVYAKNPVSVAPPNRPDRSGFELVPTSDRDSVH